MYFSRRQLFTVTSLFVTASALIFFLGILIGQSIEERKLLRREGPAVQGAVKSGAPKGDQDLTFYDTLTKPEAVPSAEATRGTVPNVKNPWTVQVAAIRNRATADKMVAELTKAGYRAYLTSGTLNQQKFYRVRVGAHATRQGAMADLERLKAAKYKNAMITRN